MQISGQGKADHLAKLLLGVQEPCAATCKPSSSPKGGKDRVLISEQAKELQRIQTLANEPDPARAERINRIRQSMESGTYQISGRAVGDAMIKHALTESVL
jgi:negative regulator of flagellin synthesis FlgM